MKALKGWSASDGDPAAHPKGSGGASPFGLRTVNEPHPGSHERDQMRCVDPPPSFLGHQQWIPPTASWRPPADT
jgi:hypothetical protein